MTTIEKEKAFLSETVSEVFERLIEGQRANHRALLNLQDRASCVEQLESENARLSELLRSSTAVEWNVDSSILAGNGDITDHDRDKSATVSISDNLEYSRLEKKYSKLLGECEQLKNVNQDLYIRLGQAQSKLKNWSRFSSPRPDSSPVVRPIIEPNVGNQVDSARFPQRTSSPDLPPLPPITAGSPLRDSKPHGLDQAITRRHGSTTSNNDPPGGKFGGEHGAPSQAEPTQSKRKREENGDSVPRATTAPPLERAGDVSNPVPVKSEHISSSFEGLQTAPRDIASSITEDLNRSRRPPTPKRRKVGLAATAYLHQLARSDHPRFNPRVFSERQPMSEKPTHKSTETEQAKVDRAKVRTPLEHININIRVLPRTSEPNRGSARKRRSGADAVHHLSEDGEDVNQQKSSKNTSFKENDDTTFPDGVDHSSVHRRLGQLLAKPSTGKPPLLQSRPSTPQGLRDRLSPKAFSNSKTAQSEDSNMPRPGPGLEDVAPEILDDLSKLRNRLPPGSERDKVISLQRARTLTQTWYNEVCAIFKDHNIPIFGQYNGPSSPRADPIPVATPEDEPLRARPLHRLSLEHFKINPLRNEGLNYAFSDVVRQQDRRKCLPGCTKPECCGGKFRAIAAELPTRDAIEHSLLSSSPPTESQAEHRLLTEYLGQGSDTQIAHLTPQEKEALLLKAKTKVVADRYGKHRHAHVRPKSPPGIWRQDFPSTQELEEDRKEADKMVRETVEERWREALMGTGRKGGRWIFADESR